MSKTKVRKTGAESASNKGKRKAAAADVTSQKPAVAAPSGSATDLAEKIKELVRLAQEQGQLTYNDINEALPESESTPEKLDEIFTKLRALEIEIVDQAEVDHVKKPESEEEDTSAAGHSGRPGADVSEADGAGGRC